MGASDFHDTVAGTRDKVAEVFSACVLSSAYDYGHSGYTGTIAEKDSYEIVKIDYNKAQLALLDRIATDPEFAAHWEGQAKWRKNQNGIDYAVSLIEDSYGKETANAEWLVKCGLSPLQAGEAIRLMDDKWGPAAAVFDDEKGIWHFFGWASS